MLSMFYSYILSQSLPQLIFLIFCLNSNLNTVYHHCTVFAYSMMIFLSVLRSDHYDMHFSYIADGRSASLNSRGSSTKRELQELTRQIEVFSKGINYDIDSDYGAAPKSNAGMCQREQDNVVCVILIIASLDQNFSRIISKEIFGNWMFNCV